jgi:hypothetical protein
VSGAVQFRLCHCGLSGSVLLFFTQSSISAVPVFPFFEYAIIG